MVVQLPGVQDTAKAKDIIGRTATLEVRMVEDTAEAMEAVKGGPVPLAWSVTRSVAACPSSSSAKWC